MHVEKNDSNDQNELTLKDKKAILKVLLPLRKSVCCFSCSLI